MSRVLGYRGFYIESNNAFGQRNLKTIAVGSDPELENLLYDSCPTALPSDIRDYFDECIQGQKVNANIPTCLLFLIFSPPNTTEIPWVRMGNMYSK